MYPRIEQIMPLAQDPTPGPIAMVNLLESRDRAPYRDGRSDDIAGQLLIVTVGEVFPPMR